MFCSNCGKQIVDGVKFCPNCGVEVLLFDQQDNKKKQNNNLAIGAVKLGFKASVAPVVVPFKIMKWGLGIKTLKCPRCDSKKINKVKPGMMESAMPGAALLMFGPLGLLAKQPKTLFVCKKCGFSWENR